MCYFASLSVECGSLTVLRPQLGGGERRGGGGHLRTRCGFPPAAHPRRPSRHHPRRRWPRWRHCHCPALPLICSAGWRVQGWSTLVPCACSGIRRARRHRITHNTGVDAAWLRPKTAWVVGADNDFHVDLYTTNNDVHVYTNSRYWRLP
jgi:hypothetical protein